ncbi:MAG: ABC transporter permease [Planctomycetota bacterium]
MSAPLEVAGAWKLPRWRMTNLARKELWALLVNPVSWIIFLLFYLFRAIELMNIVAHHAFRGDADIFVSNYFQTASTQFAVIMIPPILTMRSFAEEKRSGSLELLLTAPYHDHEVVLGKWLAAWVFYGLLWLPTLLLLYVLQSPYFLNTSFHYGYVFSSYVGVFSFGSLLLAAGLFTSSLTDNQVLASLSSMLFGLGLLVLPNVLSQSLAPSRQGVDAGFLSVLLDQAYVLQHLWKWFFRGLIDSGHMVFYLSTTALFLFLTVRVVEARKWR